MRPQHLRQIANGLPADDPARAAAKAVIVEDAGRIARAGRLFDQPERLAGQTAEHHRAGLRVGTAITEGKASVLVNRRMIKSQQMRWARRGIDLLLQVRGTVHNGTFGSGLEQKFQPADDPRPPTATTA